MQIFCIIQSWKFIQMVMCMVYGVWCFIQNDDGSFTVFIDKNSIVWKDIRWSNLFSIKKENKSLL